MAKTIKYYEKQIISMLKENHTYNQAVNMQVYSLASAMRNLEMANTEIGKLKETTIYEETRYGSKLAPHPVFKIAKEAQELITRQMKALGLTVEDLGGGTKEDQLTDETKKLNDLRKNPVILKKKTE